MQKVKEFLRSRKMRVTMLMSLAMAIMCMSAFAEDGGATTSSAAVLTSSFQSGFQQIVTDAMSVLGTIIVVALPLAGAIFLARKALGWFKSMAK